MEQKLNDIVARALDKINAAASNKELVAVKVDVLGKSGELTGVLRNMKDLPVELRPVAVPL